MVTAVLLNILDAFRPASSQSPPAPGGLARQPALVRVDGDLPRARADAVHFRRAVAPVRPLAWRAWGSARAQGAGVFRSVFMRFGS